MSNKDAVKANTVFSDAPSLLAAEGMDLGHSEWLTITQDRINQFAEATGDHQWIHVDPIKAAEGPFGACIAHGYLTLSLVNWFLPQLIEVQNLAMGVNYGCDKVRFPAAVPVGSRIRGQGIIVQTEQIKSAVQATIRVCVEIEGQDRPACVIETISRYSFNPSETTAPEKVIEHV